MSFGIGENSEKVKAQETVKCHLGLVKILKKKSETGPIPWTFW